MYLTHWLNKFQTTVSRKLKKRFAKNRRLRDVSPVTEALEDRALLSTLGVNYGNQQGWDWAPSAGSPEGYFTIGPGTPTLPGGSFQYNIGADGDEGLRLFTAQYSGTALSDITSLSYSTYTQNSYLNLGEQHPYLVLALDFDGVGSTIEEYLFFEPEYQNGYSGTIPTQSDATQGVWATWNALVGGWWSLNGTAGAAPGTDVKSLADILAVQPTAKIADVSNSVRFNAGFGAPSWTNYIGNLDNFTIGISSVDTTFDFGANPTTVYVDDDWSAVPLGDDPDGAGVANAIGFDAFATIAPAVNAVAANGTINVLAGTYAEAVDLNQALTLKLLGNVTINSLTGIAGATIDLNGFTLTVGDATNTSFAGVISGTGGNVIKTGVGTLTLTGANTYSGTTTINAGPLHINGSITSNTIVSAAGILGGTGTVTGTVSGIGVFSPGNSPGILNISGAFNPAGLVGMEVNGTTPGTQHDQFNVTGTVDITGSSLATGGTISSSPGQVVVLINNDGTDLVTGTFSGLAEGAQVTIAGVNFAISYIGGTGNDVVLIEADLTVGLDASGNLVITDTLTASSDSLTLVRSGTNLILTDANGAAQYYSTVPGVTGNGTNVLTIPLASITGSQVIFNTAGGNDTLNLDYTAGSFTKTVVFNAGAGTDSLNIIGSSSSVTLQPNGSTPGKQDGTILVGADSVQFDGIDDSSINITGTSTITIEFAGGDSNIDFTRLDADTTQVSGNSFPTTNFDNPSSLLTLRFTDTNTYDVDIIDLADTFNPTGGIIAEETAAANTDITITDLGDAFARSLNVQLGAGTDSITLTGTATNDRTYTNVTLRAETINANASGATLTVTGNTILDNQASGNAVSLTNNNDFGTVIGGVTGTVSLTDLNGINFNSVAIVGSLNVIANGAISDSGTVAVTGTTTFDIGAGNSILLDQAANNFGTVVITSANNVTLNDAATGIDFGASTISGALNVTANGLISDSGNVSVSGTATFAAGTANNIVLDASNNFSTVVITTGNNVTLNDTGAIILGASSVTGNLIVTAGGNVTQSGALNIDGNTSITATGFDVDLTNGSNDFGDDYGTTFNDRINVTAANISLLDNTGYQVGNLAGSASISVEVPVSNSISQATGTTISGAGNLTKAGGGILVLSQTNAYDGSTIITGGTLRVDVAASTGAANVIPDTSDVTVGVGTALDLWDQASETIDGLTGAGSVTRGTVGGPSTLIIGANNATGFDFTGTLLNGGGTVALTKIGIGTQTLSGTNTYTGLTSINNGQLNINGSITSSVTVSTSGTLGGTGTITGNVTGTGNVSPGVSPGILNVTGTFNPSGTLTMEVNGATPGTQHDQVNVVGGVNIIGVALSTSGTITSSPGQTIVLINNDSNDAVTGTFATLTEGSTVTINGVNFIISYSGGTNNNDVILTEASSQLVLDGSNNLVFNDVGATTNDAVTVTQTATHVTVSQPGQVIYTSISGATGSGTSSVTIPLASIAGTQFIFNTGAGNDTLTVDFSAGSFTKIVTFNGGSQTTSDALVVTGGTTTSVTHTFTNANDGSVVLAGALAGTINYTGLEPVTDNINATDRVFTFNGGSETITLTDAAGANMTIDSTLGESVTFANPTGSLTINAGTGDDTITISSVDANGPFNVDLTINGGTENDIVNLNGAITFAAGENLIVNAETFNTSAAGSATVSGAGTITITADDVELNPTSSLAAVGTVTIQQQTANRLINLGSEIGGSVSLTDTELDRVSAATINIGNATSGTITVSNTISRAASTVLNLTTGGNIAFSGGSANLNSASGNVTLTTGAAGTITSGTAATDISAGPGNLSLNTGTAIGALGNPLAFTATNLNTTAVGNGDQYLNGSATIDATGLDAGTGTIFLTGGTLTWGGANRITDTTAIAVSGTAQWNLDAFNETVAGVLVNLSGLTDGLLSTTGILTSTSDFDVRMGTISAILGGSVGLTKTTAGIVQLTRANSYTGLTQVNVGLLNVTADGALGTTAAGTTVAATGTLHFQQDVNYTTLEQVTLNGGTLLGSNFSAFAGDVVLGASGSQISVGTGARLTLTGAIDDGASTFDLTKAGSGTLQANGASTFGGTFTISAGVLAGAGSFTCAVSVSSGAIINPGISGVTTTSIISTGNLALASGSTYIANVNGITPGTQHDQLNVTGTVDVTGATLTAGGSITSNPGQTITLINNDGTDAVTGTFSGLAEGATVVVNGINFVISYFGGTDSNDVVLIQPGAQIITGTAGDDSIQIREITLAGNDYIEYLLGGVSQATWLSSTITTITVNAGDGDDTLTVNYGGTGGFFNKNITYNGQGQTTSPNGDELIITGGSVTTITHTFTNANDGIVDLDGTTISYTGLEPVTDNMAAVNRIFTFNGGAETITVTDGVAADNMTQIDSTLGESVYFVNPTGSLTINAGSGDDIITITSVDAAFNVDLTINGDAADDTVNLNGAITFAAGESLVVNAEIFNTGAAGAATVSGAGTITITADNVELNATSTLTSAGTVTIQPQTATRAVDLGTNTAGQLSLTDTELDRISASRLIIGNGTTGAITISLDVSPASVTTLRLNNNSTVTGTTGGIIVPSLAIQTTGAVGLFDSSSSFTNLAIDTTNDQVSINEADGFTVTTVDGLDGIDGSDISLFTFAGNITVANTVAANDINASGGIFITLNANDALLTVAASANLQAGAGSSFTADKMDLQGTITAPGQTVTLQNSNGADLLDLGSTTDAAANTLELSDAELDRVTANLIRVGSSGMGAITVSAVIDTLSTNNLHLITGAGVSQSGAGSIIESNLAISAGGAVAMATNNNALATLAITTTTGDITFAENNGLSISSLDSVNGVSTGAGSVTITLQAGDLTVTNTAAGDDILATTGITLTVQGNDASVVINTTADVETSGGNILITADEMQINGTITASGGTQIVTLQPQNASEAIVLGTNPGNANTLELSDAELDRVTAGGALRIGRSNAGDITFTGSISPALATVLHLITGAAIVDSNGTNPDVTIANLAIESVTGIGATGTDSGGGLEINATNLAFRNTTSGNVQFTEAAGGLGYTINSVDGVTTSFNQGTGTTILNANSPITFAVNTSSGGTLTANANESATLDFDDITVNAGVTVQSTGGDVIFNAGDRILLAATSVVQSTFATGNVTLNSGVLDSDNSASQTLDGTITAAGGTVTIDLRAEAGNATQAAGGTINATNLLLLGTGTGAFDLNNSTTNTVATIAASVGGAIDYRDADGITVGTVGATDGIVTTNDAVYLHAGGTLAINQQFNTGGGDIRILTTAGVTQAAAGVITADELGIRAVDSVLLNAVPSNVTTLAALTTTGTTGTIVYRETGSVTIGTVGVYETFTATSGLTTTNSDVLVHASTSIAINQAVAVGTADVRLVAGTGSVTQNATGAITADELGVRAGTSIALASASNDVTEFAANSSGTIEFSDINSFTVGAVTAQTSGVATFTATTGVTSNGNDTALVATTNIVIDEDVAVGAGDLLLSAGGTITQNAGDDVTGTGLSIRGLLATPTTGGQTTLTNTGNSFTNVVASTGQTIHYVDATAINVGSVNVTTTTINNTQTGITTTDDDVTLRAVTGSITINQAINLGAETTGGDLELILNDNASVSVTQGAAGNILGHGLALLGTGTGPYQYTLDNVGNDVLNIAADFTTGVAAFALRYQDATDLHVNVVTGLTATTTGINTGVPASGGGVRLRAGQTNPAGILYVDNDINTNTGTGGDLTIGGGVIFTAGNTFNGAGDIDLEGGASSPDIIVNTVTTHNMTGGTVTYRPDRDIFINRPVTVNNGHFILDADGEDPVISQTIANTSANLGTGDGVGGVWVRDQGSLDVNSGVNGGGSLIVAGSLINNTPNGGPAYVAPTALVAGAGIQIDDTTEPNELTAATTISVLVKTAGAAGNDLQVDGTITADANGAINVQVEDTLTLNSSVAQTTAGNIFIDAEDMVINTTTAVIDARPTGFVHLRNRTAGRQIDIGTNTAGQLGLTDLELDRIATAAAVRIGRRTTSPSGNINVTNGAAGAIDLANNTVLHLISGAEIVDSTGGFITETNLALEAASHITLNTGTDDNVANDHDVTFLAMATFNAGADAAFYDRNGFTIASIDGINGINVVDTASLYSGVETTQPGDVLQTAPVIADDLQLLGQGTYTLVLTTNDVNNLAATVLNSINYTDADDVTVTTVTNPQLGITTDGTSSASIVLTAPRVNVDVHMITTSELGFIVFDVTGVGFGGVGLNINGDLTGGALVNPIIDSKGFVQQYGVGTVELQGAIITTNDNVGFSSAVQLTANTSINTGTGAGDITFSSFLRGTTPAATPTFENLTLTAGTGDILFNGAVGLGGFPLGVVTINSAQDVTANSLFLAREVLQVAGTGETRFNGLLQTNQPNGVNLTGNFITFNGPVQTLGTGVVVINNLGDFEIVAGAGSVNADGAFSQTGAGDSKIGGDIITTDDNISFADDVYLTGTPLQMNAGTANASFAKRLQLNNKTLTIRDGNAIELGTITTLAGGTLTTFVGNTATRNTINVGSGEVLTGAGTLNTHVAMLSGSQMAPALDGSGLGTGILTINGNTSFAANSVLAMELNGATAGSGYDQLVTGAGFSFTVDPAAILQMTNYVTFNPANGTVLRIIDHLGATAVTGTFAGTGTNPIYVSGVYYNIAYNSPAGDITLTRVASPVTETIMDDVAGPYPATIGSIGTFNLINGSGTDTWQINSVVGVGYLNDLRFNTAGSGASQAVWTFTGLTAGTAYRVSATWRSHANRATNAPFTITGGGAPVNVAINQKNQPDDYTNSGVTWEDLSTSYTITGTTLTVTLTDNANGYVIADAIRIEAVTSAAPEVKVEDTTSVVLPAAGTDIVDNTGEVDFGSVVQGSGDVDRQITVRNTGYTTLILGSGSITPPTGFQVIGYSATTVAPGAYVSFTVRLLDDNAGNFSGQIAFNTNDFNENPFNFTVKGSVLSTTVSIIDNPRDPAPTGTGFANISGPGYAESGAAGWHNNDDSNVGYLNDLRYATANSNATATWTFTGLVPNTAHRVSATWRTHANRATNAAYTISDGSTTINVGLNQRLQPNDLLDANVWWEDLVASFPVGPSGTLTITLTALGTDGFVIADAIRVERLVPLVAAGGELQTFAPVPSVTEEELVILSQAAVDRWSATDLTAEQRALLASVTFAIADLPGAMLGGETSHTIFVDINAAGHGWYIDQTPEDDVEFSKPISANELAATELDAAFGMDLLTVLMHEIGHRLGLDDLDPATNPHELMTGELDTGLRRLPADVKVPNPVLVAETEVECPVGDLDDIFVTLTDVDDVTTQQTPPALNGVSSQQSSRGWNGNVSANGSGSSERKASKRGGRMSHDADQDGPRGLKNRKKN